MKLQRCTLCGKPLMQRCWVVQHRRFPWVTDILCRACRNAWLPARGLIWGSQDGGWSEVKNVA